MPPSIPPSKPVLQTLAEPPKPSQMTSSPPASKYPIEVGPPQKEGVSKEEPKPLAQAEPLILRSSIRTMADDVAALRRGQPTVGVKTEKMAETQPKEIKKQPGQQVSRGGVMDNVELGELERARTLEGEKAKSFRLVRPNKGEDFEEASSPPPPQAPAEPGKTRRDFAITDQKPGEAPERTVRAPASSSIFSGFSRFFRFAKGQKQPELPTERVPGTPPSGVNVPAIKKLPISPRLAMALVGVLVIFGAAWYFITKEPNQVVQVETPTPEVIETPFDDTPQPTSRPETDPLVSAFGEIGTFVFPSTADPLSTFNNFVQSRTLDIQEVKMYKVEDETGSQYSFKDFLAKFLIQIPENISATIDSSDFLVVIYRPEVSGEFKAGLIVRSNDSIKTASGLRIWEGTLSEDFNDMLGFNTQNAASAGFLDNVHNGVSIRYRNFPTPADTIDYAVITLPTGANYLLIINSKESVYMAIEKLLGL